MEAHIVKKYILRDIPSASGIEVMGDEIFVIGDDVPYLFVVNKELRIVRKILLASRYHLVKGRIPKIYKPDFEAIATLDFGGEKLLLVLGSGSLREKRDKAFLIEAGEKDIVKEYSLVPLYDLLRNDKSVVQDTSLNIEAATVINNKIYLFQRGNISGVNVILEFPLYSFVQFLQDGNSKVPAYKTYDFYFEKHHNLVPGFSGATSIPGSEDVLFTASLEDTPNAWYDGDIFESFIGIISKGMKTFKSTVILDKGQPFKGKVESVAIINYQKNDPIKALAVTDSDGDASELLVIEVKK